MKIMIPHISEAYFQKLFGVITMVTSIVEVGSLLKLVSIIKGNGQFDRRTCSMGKLIIVYLSFSEDFFCIYLLNP